MNIACSTVALRNVKGNWLNKRMARHLKMLYSNVLDPYFTRFPWGLVESLLSSIMLTLD